MVEALKDKERGRERENIWGAGREREDNNTGMDTQVTAVLMN